MNNRKPSSGPRTLFSALLLASAAILILATASVGQDSPATSALTRGRAVAVAGPVHATVAAGKVLAPSTKFATVSRRGSRPAPVRPSSDAPITQDKSSRRPAGVLLM